MQSRSLEVRVKSQPERCDFEGCDFLFIYFLESSKRGERPAGDAYALVWESEELLEVGRAFMKLLAKGAGQQAITLALSTTMYGMHAPRLD